MPGLVPGIAIHEAALGRMNRDGGTSPAMTACSLSKSLRILTAFPVRLSG
jgi:hypothetical protein